MNTVLIGDALRTLLAIKSESIQCCVTSPPYWGLRDYGIDGQLGLEETPEEYVEKMVHIFNEIKRVLRNNGTLWLNLGDSYASTQSGFKHDRKSKDLVGIPWRIAFALQDDGWYLRSDIIWHKPNPIPESVTDRPTKSHEYLFLLTKSEKYYYDQDAIREPGKDLEDDIRRIKGDIKYFQKSEDNQKVARSWNNHESDLQIGNRIKQKMNHPNGRNKRSVWTIPTAPYSQAHFATFPPDLVKPCILAGTKPGDIVLDPFSGSGTVGAVCADLSRQYLGIELNPEYANMRRDERNVMTLPL